MSRGGREGHSESGVTQSQSAVSEYSPVSRRCGGAVGQVQASTRGASKAGLTADSKALGPHGRPQVTVLETPGKGDKGTFRVWEPFGAS